MDDVFGEDVDCGAGGVLRKRHFETGGMCVGDDLVQPIATRGDVVGQQIDAVETAQR